MGIVLRELVGTDRSDAYIWKGAQVDGKLRRLVETDTAFF